MKAFITVIGKDRVGIIAGISAALAELSINIEDISQTVLQGMFTMIMAVDITESSLSVKEIQQKLSKKGEEMDVEVTIRLKDIFEAMHRVL